MAELKVKIEVGEIPIEDRKDFVMLMIHDSHTSVTRFLPVRQKKSYLLF